MSRPYVLAKGASADIQHIARHTEAQWGHEQRLAYMAQLEQAVVAVAKGEGIFKDMNKIHPGLRMAKAGKHYIFCLCRPNASAVILAVFHERMDIMARLEGRLG